MAYIIHSSVFWMQIHCGFCLNLANEQNMQGSEVLDQFNRASYAFREQFYLKYPIYHSDKNFISCTTEDWSNDA